LRAGRGLIPLRPGLTSWHSAHPTPLTEWLAAGPAAPTSQRSAAWLSLDKGDNDPASFWTYVIAALQTVAQGVGASALTLLREPQPLPITTVLTALLNDLGAVTSDLVLVLDDYHVIDSRDVQDGMAFLLDHLPQQLHLVIASRADPAIRCCWTRDLVAAIMRTRDGADTMLVWRRACGRRANWGSHDRIFCSLA
jgi:hypothetical protein